VLTDTFPDLSQLQTVPEHQRRGAGGMLLKWGTDEAARLGLPVFLCASEEGLSVYRRAGFVELEVTETDMTQYGGPGIHRLYWMKNESQGPTRK